MIYFQFKANKLCILGIDGRKPVVFLLYLLLYLVTKIDKGESV